MLGLTPAEYLGYLLHCRGFYLQTLIWSDVFYLQTLTLVTNLVKIVSIFIPFFQMWKQNHKLLNCLHKPPSLEQIRAKKRPQCSSKNDRNKFFLSNHKKEIVYIHTFKLFKGSIKLKIFRSKDCVCVLIYMLYPFFFYCLVLGYVFDGGSCHIVIFQISGMLLS